MICGKCGELAHVDGATCPAANTKCWACDGIGHRRAMCRNPKPTGSNGTSAAVIVDTISTAVGQCRVGGVQLYPGF